jgi:alpha-1,6-mannosyltransferase
VAIGFLVRPDAPRGLVPYLLLFLAGSLVAIQAARSLSGSGRSFLLVCGALFRATLLWHQPDLSDDLYRYVWDGRVARAGVSPYLYAPDDPALSRVDPSLRARVAHRNIRTVYPPAAQAVFRVLGDGGSVILLKSFLALADLSVVALLWASGGGRGAFAAALYAFHPLPLTEVAGEGHLDSLGVALLLSSLIYLSSNRRAAAGLAFAASILTKYVAMAAAIPIFRRGRLACILSAMTLSGALWVSASRGGVGPAGGLAQFATRWDFNSVLYPAGVRLMEVMRLPETAKDLFIEWKDQRRDPPWAARVFPYFYSAFFARVLLAAGLAVLLVAIGVCIRELETAVFASLAALLLFSPTLYPWYLLWVLPLAAKRQEPAFLFLSFCVPISYALTFPLPGVPAPLILALEYVPFTILLVRTLWLSSRRSPIG